MTNLLWCYGNLLSYNSDKDIDEIDSFSRAHRFSKNSLTKLMAHHSLTLQLQLKRKDRKSQQFSCVLTSIIATKG